jgi:acetoacetyl-CoA synthetase
MNVAENLLYSRKAGALPSIRETVGKEDTKIALTEVREGATEIRHISWGRLRRDVTELASAMRGHGVKKGDRIIAVASNSVDTLKVFLAITSLGGLFSSSSTDMGVQGVLQRAMQIAPIVMSPSDIFYICANLTGEVYIYGRLCYIQWQED